MRPASTTGNWFDGVTFTQSRNNVVYGLGFVPTKVDACPRVDVPHVCEVHLRLYRRETTTDTSLYTRQHYTRQHNIDQTHYPCERVAAAIATFEELRTDRRVFDRYVETREMEEEL